MSGSGLASGLLAKRLRQDVAADVEGRRSSTSCRRRGRRNARATGTSTDTIDRAARSRPCRSRRAHSTPTEFVRKAARDARVDDIDHAADRRRSEQQRRRAAQHLDTLGGQRVDRDRRGPDPTRTGRGCRCRRSGRARGRRTGRAAPARGGGPEAGSADARLARERFADACPHLARQVGFVEDRYSAKDIVRLPPDACDDDVVTMVVMRVLGISGCRRVRRFRLAVASVAVPPALASVESRVWAAAGTDKATRAAASASREAIIFIRKREGGWRVEAAVTRMLYYYNLASTNRRG